MEWKAWILQNNISDHLESFEMWTYTRILKVSWVDKVTKNEYE